MNGTEQKARFTAVSRIEKRLDDVEEIVVALDTRTTEIAKVTLAAIDDERAAHAAEITRLEARIADLEHDDVAHERVIVRLRPLAEPTFLQRLSWLLTGRT